MVGLFLAIVTPLVVIVWWEFTRARGAPRSVSRAFKRHLDGQTLAPPPHVVKETKRGFDTWN
jgi:hypothetical protein